MKVERAPERLRRGRGLNEERGAGFRPDRMIEVEGAHGAEKVAHAAAAQVSLMRHSTESLRAAPESCCARNQRDRGTKSPLHTPPRAAVAAAYCET